MIMLADRSSHFLGHHSAAPVALWLRVPLSWYTSATFAQFPDETRSSIQRTFVSPFANTPTRRQFCGYCGTQLSSWNERTRDDAEHICLTVGSLLDEDQEALGRLGFLPGDSSDEESSVTGAAGAGGSRENTRVVQRAFGAESPAPRGAPWFEEMVEHTRFGKLKHQRGGHSGRNVKVEWEVVEWTEGDDADDERPTSSPSKRKIGELDDDTEMRMA